MRPARWPSASACPLTDRNTGGRRAMACWRKAARPSKATCAEFLGPRRSSQHLSAVAGHSRRLCGLDGRSATILGRAAPTRPVCICAFGDASMRFISNFIDINTWCALLVAWRRVDRFLQILSPPVNTYNLSDWTVPRNRLVIAYLAALVLPTAAGCGQGPKYATATVSGHIAIDGQPVPRGAVTFSPMTGTSGAVVGGEIKTGEYRCDGVPLGKLNVTFVAQSGQTGAFRREGHRPNPPGPQRHPASTLCQRYHCGNHRQSFRSEFRPQT